MGSASAPPKHLITPTHFVGANLSFRSESTDLWPLVDPYKCMRNGGSLVYIIVIYCSGILCAITCKKWDFYPRLKIGSGGKRDRLPSARTVYLIVVNIVRPLCRSHKNFCSLNLNTGSLKNFQKEKGKSSCPFFYLFRANTFVTRKLRNSKFLWLWTHSDTGKVSLADWWSHKSRKGKYVDYFPTKSIRWFFPISWFGLGRAGTENDFSNKSHWPNGSM